MWKNSLSPCNSLQNRIFGTEKSIQRLPWLNLVITVYVGAVLLIYMLFMIAPFITFLCKTPFYHISSYLGILGSFLLILDLFTNKGLWRSPCCILLYGICAMSCISALRTIQYGIHDNLFDICWVVIQFALIYSWVYRLNSRQMAQFFRILYPVCLSVWFVACCVSLYQFAYQIGYRYTADTLSLNPELTRQGFLQHRLFGVFTGLDYAVYVSLMLIIIGVYFFGQTEKLWKKILLAAMMFVLLMHIILSGSRSVQISLFLYAFFYVWLQVRNRISSRGFRRIAVQCVASICAVAICAGCFFGLKYAAQYIPTLFNAQISIEDDVLERDSLEGDVSNNRFAIWKDYISLYKDIGLVGLSLSNYNDYIKDNHSDLYIVHYFQEDFGNAEKSDMVYESHNNYLFVFVSVGLLGLLLFAAFLGIFIIRLLRYISLQKTLSAAFIAALAVVCVGCVEAFFMNSVFLKINAPSFFFWFAFGYLMWKISPKYSLSVAV